MESNDRDHARERKRLLLVLALCLLFAGCEGAPSALDAAGPGAARIAGLWWVLLGMASFVTIGVIVLLAMALMARPREGRPSERRNKALIVGGGIVLPGVMIPIIIYLTFTTLAQFPEVGTDRHPLEETEPGA